MMKQLYKVSVKAVMKKPREYGRLLPTSFDIDLAEKMFLTEPQVQMPVYHHFGPGIYMREIHIPKGTLILGHEHIGECTNVFLKGKMRLLQPDGTWKLLQAPMWFTGGPGRKAALALEDCIWQNIFATTETDIEVLENTLVRKSQAFLQHEKEHEKCQWQLSE